jgi:hypothetical protein
MRAVPIAMVSVCLVLALAAAAMSLATLESFDPVPGDPDLALGSYTHPAGGPTLDLSVGIGSGVYRGPLDVFPLSIWDVLFQRFHFGRLRNPVEDAFWTVSDRGPNFQCEEASLVIGLADTVACPAAGAVAAGVGRIYPRPDYSPSIFRVLLLRDGTFRIAKTIPLRTLHGHPVLGLPNPLTVATTEVPRDGNAQVIARDAGSVDAEALVRVPLFGGRFLIGEENGPSILEVTDDGRVSKRFVPAGTEQDFTAPAGGLAPADYAIEGSLPAILAKRRLNRGIESLAISPDFRFVYALLQSPLDNPTGSGAVRDSGRLRLLKLRIHWRPEGSSLEPVGEWVYLLEPAATFIQLGESAALRRRDLRVSEMLRVGPERFLVLERTDLITILYEVELTTGTNILGSPFDDLATSPSLEQVADLAAVGITPLAKTQRLIASSLPGANPQFPQKLEGLAIARDGRLVVINDDDFGITNQRTRIDLVTGALD